mgnify:CR=1 FL=1
MTGMGTPSSLHQAIRNEISAHGRVTTERLEEMLAKHPAPELPDENDLVILDGSLHVEVKECNCVASDSMSPEGCGHEYHCGLDPIIDIEQALKTAGYEKPFTGRRRPSPAADQSTLTC